MPAHSSKDHRFEAACAWDPDAPAEFVTDDVLLSRGVSSSYLIASPEGDIVINTGTRFEGSRHRARFEELLGRPLKVGKIIFTQDHPDHVGGWQAFDDPGVEVIAQESFTRGRADRNRLKAFFRPWFHRMMSGFSEAAPQSQPSAPPPPVREPEPTTFSRFHHFSFAGRDVELYSLPGGETTNCLAVWLPAARHLFVGNHMGALYGALPNLITLRGDRPRSAQQFLSDLEVLLQLPAEILLTGHDDPVRGADRIRGDLTRLRDALGYIHDETVRGMNDGLDLRTLMHQVRLPAELETASGRGPVRWYVRTIWEEYAGWFRHELASDLYDVPAQRVWPELAELCGGAGRLTERAAARLDDGEPVEALHLLEIALTAEPRDEAALALYARVLEQLIDQTEGRTYDELVWLETELQRAAVDYSDTRYGRRPA